MNPDPTPLPPAAPGTPTVLERGWLSANNIVLHGQPGEGAVLVDTGHCNHAGQTLALLRHALRGEPLRLIVNTHLHSDHCGGNASVGATFSSRILVPAGPLPAVLDWDEDRLGYRATGQRCPRFGAAGALAAGERLTVGTRPWEVLAAPGHDPDALMLFDATDGVLISADALWQNGFGVVFPELDGIDAFDRVAETLALIKRIAPTRVIPGHGAPFDDVAAALQRADTRLSRFVANPALHARHAGKVLLKYHLMEEQQQALDAARSWAETTPLFESTRSRSGFGGSPGEWFQELLAELLAVGALRLDDRQRLHDV
ncbi:MAG: hypothetical protein RL654_2408 [Pseudomonadota bacterium]